MSQNLSSTDFFDPTARNSRARLAVSVELMRELSRYSDPAELSRVFAKRMNQLYPTARQITLSRRGLEFPFYRVTRFNLWKDATDPYREPHKLPKHVGGLFAELTVDENPRVMDELTLEPGDPAAAYVGGQGSLLSIPLFDGGSATDVVIVTRDEPNAFPREQIPELVWLTNLFGRAVQSLLLSAKLRDVLDSAEYELRTIGEMQQSLLPQETPSVPGLDLAVHYRTACRAGGDYYDFFPLPGGRMGVLVGDVSGHGTPASVLMAITHTLAHSMPDLPESPGEFLAYLNVHLARRYTLTTGNFITAIYAVFDPHRGTLTFSNAGHTAPRLRRHGDGRFHALDQSRRLPLGVTHRTAGPYPEQTVELRAGDDVVLFTDGMTDGTNAAGEPFGLTRLDAALGGDYTCAACAVTAVSDAVDAFTGGRTEDDRTLVLVRRSDVVKPKVKRAAAYAELDTQLVG